MKSLILKTGLIGGVVNRGRLSPRVRDVAAAPCSSSREVWPRAARIDHPLKHDHWPNQRPPLPGPPPSCYTAAGMLHPTRPV